MNHGDQKTVFVGLSGGVDSSVAAHLLLEQNYNVVGVFIRTWQPEFIECTWRDERRDAMRVAAHLGIPFLECDAEDAYKKGVADYMIAEYKIGRTPNPDVMCNREVKFGVFWQFAKEHGADFIATGHYARTDNTLLKTGIDESKDQSYFLWTLTEEDLAHTLFPVGHLQKSEVRIIAERAGLMTAAKKDSQGVCFLGPLDMKDFLKHYLQSEQGNVLNEEGQKIGTHDGAMFYTLGERHGFSITEKNPDDGACYVIAKDIQKNTIIVSQTQPFEKNSAVGMKEINLENVIIRGALPTKKITACVRYHGEQYSGSLMKQEDNYMFHFDQPVLVAPGQSVVFFDGEICVGGGVVS